MQDDDVTWSIINKSFCSYKSQIKGQKFCRNEYNLTGLCTRSSCPLANSRYATVKEENGVVYLFAKTAERSPFPRETWQRTKLSRNFEKAVRQIDAGLLHWPAFLKSKCKQRFVKITQSLIRTRKLALRRRKLIVPIQSKVERRERRREEKALLAARLESGVEKALLERLKRGVYGDLYGVSKDAFLQAEQEREIEMEIEDGGREFVEAESDSGDAVPVDLDSSFESSGGSDIEDLAPQVKGRNWRRGKGPPVLEIEYDETENKTPRKLTTA